MNESVQRPVRTGCIAWYICIKQLLACQKEMDIKEQYASGFNDLGSNNADCEI